MQRVFVIRDRTVNCEINFYRRRTISISVKPDKTVEIKMPLLCTVNDAEDFLLKHYRWLFKRLDAVEEKGQNAVKKYVDGELHYFLGKQYPLSVILSDKFSVQLKDDAIVIHTKSLKYTQILLEEWYMQQARRVFAECSVPLLKQMSKYKVAPNSFTVKKLKSKWGSCSSKKNINLNMHLVKLPEQCIKEVILHELCHLVYFNHSKEFYDLMTAEMPDWKVWDKQLKFL